MKLDSVLKLGRALESKSRIAVITGAGISTDSGIPDYRGPNRIKPATPMMFQAFSSSDSSRRKYWARAFLGHGLIANSLPNTTHITLQKWAHRSKIITQNVDSLHLKANSQATELHGHLRDVVCLDCRHEISRAAYQDEIRIRNPQWKLRNATVNPDGDVDFDPEELGLSYDDFVIPQCTHCGSTRMKPTVVFYGEQVPLHTVEEAEKVSEQADAFLVLGSTLTTWSAFRIIRKKKELFPDFPVYIVNLGVTRADHLATIKIEESCSFALETIDKNYHL